MKFCPLPTLVLLSFPAIATAGLVVREIDAPPASDQVRISQLERDETGPTSFRFYAPRSGKPTKTDDWVYRFHEDKPDGTLAHYYFRDRDLGQTFRVGEDGFYLTAITVRLQPVNVAKADPTGAKVSVQLLKVTGEASVNDNGTNAKTAPNGRSSYTDRPHYQVPNLRGKSFTNAAWSTYATDWPHDPNDANTPYRWPIMHYSDDFLEGERYEHIALVTGGIVPSELGPDDYLKWEFTGDDRHFLSPNTQYAFLFLFDEPAPVGVNRNIPLSNVNIVPEGNLTDPYPDGHMIRRDGASTKIEDVFIYDPNDPWDVEASRSAASFPADMNQRIAIPPGTVGYPDVDTYRDLYFLLEGVANR